MGLFDVYNKYDIALTRAKGSLVYDDKNQEYLDLYGGHGVISIGHGHQHYKDALNLQLDKIGFYSNAIEIPEQIEVANLFKKISGLNEHELFMCNSGSEANENALKLASFHTGKSTIIAFTNSFHGRTSASLNVTDNPNISSTLNQNNFPVVFCELNNSTQLKKAFDENEIAGVILEGIQGVGGLDEPTPPFLELIYELCEQYNAISILDEIQSGCGRTGKFFAHQITTGTPDIITMAKGIGNGFPVAGLLVHKKIKAQKGMLGTTFGGNYLACAAVKAVLDILNQEDLTTSAVEISDWFIKELEKIPSNFKIKGRGLMLGLEFEFPVAELRKTLLFEHHIFTGGSMNPKLLRILPPLNITQSELQVFLDALTKIFKHEELHIV